MSQLKARCIEQILMFENTPEISSGNVNYDSIKFEFCSSWDGFTKTAIFYRSEDEVFYQLLDEADTCIIPKEVLTERGVIHIGVFGVYDDKVITSQVLSYRISQGAITENLKPSDPTPDIYAQIISRYDAIIDELEEQFQKLEDLQGQFDGAVGNADQLGGHGAEYFVEKYQELLTTSILEKAITLPYGVHNFVLHGSDYNGNDLPDARYSYGMGTVFVRGNSSRVVVLWGSDSPEIAPRRIAVNSYNGEWTGWEQHAFISDLAKYLPLTGGTVEIDRFSGMRIKRKSDQENYYAGVMFANILGDLCGIGSDGKKDLVKFSNTGALDGYILHTGNMGDHVLPKTGGTVEKNGPVPVGLKNTNSATDEVFISFSDATGQLGMLGFKGKNTPVFYESGWTNHRSLIHTGNMGDYVLPKNGGVAQNFSVGVSSTTGSPALVFRNSENKAVGILGLYNGNLYKYNADATSYNLILDTRNSAKVSIGTTAPSDTSSLWVDTSV